MKMSIFVHVMYWFVTALAQKVIWIPPVFIVFFGIRRIIIILKEERYKKNWKVVRRPADKTLTPSLPHVGYIRQCNTNSVTICPASDIFDTDLCLHSIYRWCNGIFRLFAYQRVCSIAIISPQTKVKVKGQGQIFPKMGKNQRTGHISKAISSTDFILGTKVQPNKAHSMTQVPMTLTEGQGQRSRSNFPQNGSKTKELVISWRLFNLQTSYLVPRYNSIRRSQWP